MARDVSLHERSADLSSAHVVKSHVLAQNEEVLYVLKKGTNQANLNSIARCGHRNVIIIMA